MTTHIPATTKRRCDLCAREGRRGFTTIAEHLDADGLLVPVQTLCSSRRDCSGNANRRRFGR